MALRVFLSPLFLRKGRSVCIFVMEIKQDNTLFFTMRTLRRKAHRTSFEYRDDRGRNLLEVFNHLFNTTINARVEEVLSRAVNHPSRRFWVSEERALRVVRAMERGTIPPCFNALKREMYGEIHRRVRRLSAIHPDWPLKRLVWVVVNQEAPRFYLSVSSAHAIVVEEKKRCRIETMRRLSRFLSA